MNCPKCDGKVLFLVDGTCIKCKGMPKKGVNLPQNQRTAPETYHKPSRPQLSNTERLRARCDEYMRMYKMSWNVFAQTLNLSNTRFYRWHNGDLQNGGQKRYNKLIETILDNIVVAVNI